MPTEQEALADWEETLQDERLAAFVAEDDGQVVGSALACPVELCGAHSGLGRLDGATFFAFAFAAVRPGARGRGWGRALGAAVLDAAHCTGAPGVISDWRSTNLLSSRAWTRLGYRETFWRLHRMVGYYRDPMIHRDFQVDLPRRTTSASAWITEEGGRTSQPRYSSSSSSSSRASQVASRSTGTSKSGLRSTN